VPVYTDGGASKANALGEVESKWLWAAAEPQQWRSYFEELLSERGMAMAGGGAWIGLNLRGRTFGSAVGAPRWDELLGTALQPVGDGFGEYEEAAAREAADAAQEAAAAAVAIGVAGAGAAAAAAAAGEAAELLAAQAAFYQALNSADASAMKALWDPEVRRTACTLHVHMRCMGNAEPHMRLHMHRTCTAHAWHLHCTCALAPHRRLTTRTCLTWCALARASSRGRRAPTPSRPAACAPPTPTLWCSRPLRAGPRQWSGRPRGARCWRRRCGGAAARARARARGVSPRIGTSRGAPTARRRSRRSGATAAAVC
jgi:hypothetical protein